MKKENYILFFGRIMTNMGAMVWPMMTLILTQKMGMNASQAAVVMVVAGILIVPANLLGGRLADRCNKKMLIVYGDLVSITLFIVAGCIPLSMATVCLIVAAAIAQCMEDPPYSALIADLNPTDRRDDAYSLNYLGANIGLVLSPTIAGLLFQNYLWLCFIISGLALACSTCLIFFKLKDIQPVVEETKAAQYQKTKDGTSLFAVLRENPVLLLFLAVSGMYYMCYEQYNFLMPMDLGAAHGENGALIYGTLCSVNCLVVVLFTPVITVWARRTESPLKILAADCLQMAGFLLFAMFIGRVPAYYAAIVLFTWGEICMTISSGPYMSKRIPASHRGRINGVYSVVIIFFSLAGQLIFGRIYDKAGSLTAWRIVLVFGAVTALLCLWLGGADRKQYTGLYEQDGMKPEE